ncbi:MAG TPA: pyridoxal-phosphate dependent enzyme [Chitinophagaceae bacterium]|nr:pyridoxal-phosphate dependent enzyme [Chitinophagaceae bacterium]
MLLDLAFDDISVDTISLVNKENIEVDVLRLDKLSPVVSGNKWFKLRYYLEEAKAQHKKGILTFGGAWSNHIIATAAICKKHGLKSIGIIRGEEPKKLSFTLSHAKESGMHLIFISRSAYQQKKIPKTVETDDYYIINEGGYGKAGAKGASTILDYCTKSYTHYCCAVGTGTMMAGLINAVSPEQSVLGISVMKNNSALEKMIQTLVKGTKKNWLLIHDYHFGGYAKYQPALLTFMNEFYKQTAIPSDFVYTGKLFYAISDLIGKNYFPADSKLLLIHSGGLQGNSSLADGILIF